MATIFFHSIAQIYCVEAIGFLGLFLALGVFIRQDLTGRGARRRGPYTAYDAQQQRKNHERES